jgi:hypothetical protein
MDGGAFSPSQIESILSDRLKRHEDRLREHRAALENQKAWLHRGGSDDGAAAGVASGGGGGVAAAGARGRGSEGPAPVIHRPDVDERFQGAFTPSQVLPPDGPRVVIGPLPTSTAAGHEPSARAPPQPSAQAIGATQSLALMAASAGARRDAVEPTGGDIAGMRASSGFDGGSGARHGPQRAGRLGGGGAADGTALPRRGGAVTPRASGGGAQPTVGVAAARDPAAAALDAREHRAPRVGMSPGTGRRGRPGVAGMAGSNAPASSLATFLPMSDLGASDILSGASLMDVAAETAACTFKPVISDDSRVLARKLRAACGAQGKDVVESMEALHARATRDKWLRLQAIHEAETRQFSSAAGARAPQPGADAFSRLYSAATKKVKNERLRQIVAQSTSESAFVPAITERARALQRHPGHTAGSDLHSLATLKHQRESELVQLREALDVATARQLGHPTIDTVSASIASSLVESSFERLTRPAASRDARGPGSAAAADPAPRFTPEINRRSEMLAHMSALHSPVAVERRRQERLRALRSDVEQERMSDCTFHPTIDSRSRALSAGPTRAATPRSDFLSRTAAWAKRRDANIDVLRSEKEHEETAECSFAPALASARPAFAAAGDRDSRPSARPTPTIYGGADARAWGFDQHLDRMSAARVIEEDRNRRASSGRPFAAPGQPGAIAPAPESEGPNVGPPSNAAAASVGGFAHAPAGARTAAAPSEPPAVTLNRNSVLSRAHEALARAVAATSSQQVQSF